MDLDEQLYERWLLQLQTWAADGRLFSAGIDALRLKPSRAKDRLKSIATRLAKGDNQDLPPIELLPGGTRSGAAESSLREHLEAWQKNLQKLADDGSLIQASKIALKLTNTPQKLEEFNQQLVKSNFSSLPSIISLSESNMYGRIGAYSPRKKNIFVNREWLSTATFEDSTRVFNEEFGHHLDHILNSNDTKGDEGEYFAELLQALKQGQSIHQADLGIETNEDDRGVVNYNGQLVEVEFLAKWKRTIWIKNLPTGKGDDKQDPWIDKTKTSTRAYGRDVRDRLNAGGGNDWVYGRGGDDNITGGFDTDNLFGGSGNDFIVGKLSNERDKSTNYLFGGDGDDELREEKEIFSEAMVAMQQKRQAITAAATS